MIRPAFIVAVAAILFVLVASLNWAQQANEMNVNFHGFQDTRGVTVLSPTVDLTQDYTERTNLRINYGLDGISAASDSCARCHRDGINSHRQDGALGHAEIRRHEADLGGAYSKENFYRATTGLASVSRDLANGNTTVAGGFSFSLNQPELHPNPEHENQYQSGAFATITQTLTKTSIVQLGYELATSPDTRAIRTCARTSTASWCWDRFPTRVRHTLSARLRQALPGDTYLEADYRHYFDDWEVTSNTFSVGLSHHFGPQVLLNGVYRRYDQTGAYFWHRRTLGLPSSTPRTSVSSRLRRTLTPADWC